ncbi:MAG: histidine phosphatase family protein [Acidihalobacter sp.]|jgi:broad specificity phosphatase PhoE
MDEPHLIVVRHGATAWSETGQHTSHTDLGLTAGGLAEAQRLRPWLQTRAPAQVWVSPLRRARETAEACGYPHGQAVNELHEWDYGDYEGLTTPQIQDRFPGWSVFEHGGAGPQGETPEQVARRIDNLIERVLASPGLPVLAFAHGHLLRALAARWMELPIAAGERLALNSGSIGLLGLRHGRRTVLGWNIRHPE